MLKGLQVRPQGLGGRLSLGFLSQLTKAIGSDHGEPHLPPSPLGQHPFPLLNTIIAMETGYPMRQGILCFFCAGLSVVLYMRDLILS